MRTLLCLLVVTAATLMPAACADAQDRLRPAPIVSGPVLAGPVVGAPAVVVPAGHTWSYRSDYVRPHYYSYYVSPPLAARDYVGYGSNDFPYYGRAYGSPSDPWTWNYMSNPVFFGSLARYYYPPLP